MVKNSGNYLVKKLEKGPLQRFKNQNLLLKKFGEMGLQVYKAITGKRTSSEIQQRLEIEPDMFQRILSYMREAGMVELNPVTGTEKEETEPKKEEIEETPEEEPEEERIEAVEEEKIPEEKAAPEEEIAPIEEEAEEPSKPKKKRAEEEEISYEEIKPIEQQGEEEQEEEEETGEEPEEEKIEAVEEEAKEEEERSPVERIIEEKYGKVGLQVYKLIDGRRTAEQIMKDTGLTEAKLVEILDFMDEEGIIKLEYPKEKKAKAPEKPPVMEKEEFAPMLEQEEAEGELIAVRVPMKVPVDLVKGIRIKARVILKYSDKGTKLLDKIDGKKDAIDLAMELNMPLYEVEAVLDQFMEFGAITRKPLPRSEVKKKYGDDGYAVYKKYGKEGLMLYELIGKEMSIKEMGDRVSQNKQLVAEIFLFIHKVLGIDLPIDKEVLYKQLGVN